MKRIIHFLILLPLLFVQYTSFSQVISDGDSNCSLTLTYNSQNISPFNQISLNSAQHSIRVYLQFSSLECRETVYYDETLPWVTTQPQGWSYVDINLTANTTPDQRTVSISMNNNNLDFLGAIVITQNGNSAYSNYYQDSDSDGFGDYNATPISSLSQPAGYSSNNLDFCPFDAFSTNNGCQEPYEDINWIRSASYDIKGNLLSSSKSYFDELGKGIQTQTFDIKENRTWATQIMYDEQGRPAFQSLSAPITDNGATLNFQFKNDFIKKTDGSLFQETDFTGTNIYNPKTIEPENNTLGWYYSAQNTDEPYQDITKRPYSRTIYSILNPGTVKQTIGGNKIGEDINGDGGEWKQGYSFSMPAAQEMYYVFGYDYFEINPDIETTYTIPESITNNTNNQINWLKATKTIVEDLRGNQSVVFTDTDGKTLAAARVGVSETPNKVEKKFEVLSLIGEQKYVDIHIPVGCENIITFLGPDPHQVYKIYDLKEEVEITSITQSGFYRVEYTGGINLTKNHTLTYINKSTGTIEPVETDAVGIRYQVNYYDFSINYYTQTGQLTSSYQPIGFNDSCLNGFSSLVAHNSNAESTFKYNALGQLVSTTSPDEGTSKFLYRKDGQIRFSQNSKQEQEQEISYTSYDEFGRPVESGVFSENGIFNGIESIKDFYPQIIDENITQTNFIDDYNLDAFEQHFTEYDFLEIPADLSTSNGVYQDYHNPIFLSGNVATTYNLDENQNRISQTWYSYDLYGRVKWIVQKMENFGGTSNDKVVTIDYEYDPVTSQVLKVIYQKHEPSEIFVHRYTYNTAQELVKVETSTDDDIFITHADYSYYETGALKRTTLANGLQDIDYIYNLAGQLKAINHPSLTSDPDINPNNNDFFGMTLDYYDNDYKRDPLKFTNTFTGVDDQYNGNIKGFTWNTNTTGVLNNPSQYTYEYNTSNWLKKALFSYDNSTVSDDYKVDNITYDANGNIKSLTRNKNTENINGTDSNSMDDLVYDYTDPNKPNQLQRVQDLYTGTTKAEDIKNQTATNNYQYNSIGQLIKNIEEDVDYKYNASGLVTEVWYNNYKKVEFLYNDKGYRTKKISYQNNSTTIDTTTDYILDAAGSVLAIYENNTLQELSIYGASRLGIHNRASNSSLYQLTDHLGNVRAVISKRHNVRTHFTDFNNNSISPWVASSNTTSMNVENGRLKIVTGAHLNGANGYYDLEAFKDYKISIDIDKSAFNDAPLEFSIWKGSSKKFETYITENGKLTVNFTPQETRSYRLNFRLRDFGYSGADQTVFIDNVIFEETILNNIFAVTHATDYYPGGMVMPRRRIVNGEQYRYGYQGEFAETDEETGKPAFQLRIYDPRINRWISPDPAREFHSPYLAMGNNWVNTVDPDGGCTTCPENAKVGDTFQHADYGVVTYSKNGWSTADGAGILNDIVIGGRDIQTTNAGITYPIFLGTSLKAGATISAGTLTMAVAAPVVLFKGDKFDMYNAFAQEGKYYSEGLSWTIKSTEGYSIVDDILKRNNSSGYYIHYTTMKSAYSIMSSQTIFPNSSNKVYLTNALMSPVEAFNILFQAQETHTGRGNAVIIFKLYNSQEANLRAGGGDIFEFWHEGALKPELIIYGGPNPFGGK